MAGIDLKGSPDFPKWLDQSGFSLALTTYQTNRLLLLGSNGDGTFSGFERLFDRPMGLHAGADGERLTMATRYQIRELANVLSPDETHEGYDRVYVPRRAHTTGELDAHDLHRTSEGRIFFVNTRFSCVATPSDTHSFRPVWTPPFVSQISPEDRCHLNGLALQDGRPRYATAVSRSDVAAGWRDRREGNGIVIDVETGEIVTGGLTMPHSPCLRNGELYLINAGTGDLGRVDRDTGQFEPIAFVPGFGRGLAVRDGHAIVGLSEPRRDEVFQDLPLGRRLEEKGASPRCGLFVVDLDTGTTAHWLTFRNVVSELYDVVVLPGVRRPMALGFKTDEIQRFITVEHEERPRRFLLTLDAPDASDTDEPDAGDDGASRGGSETSASLPSFELPERARKGARMEDDPSYRLHTGQIAAAEVMRRFRPLLPNRFQQQVASGALDGEAPLLCAVAAHEDEPVGVVVADPAQSTALLRALAVAPAHRGQGLGTDLLHSIEQCCRQAGADRVAAEYRDDLTERVALERVFEKRGWSAPEVRRHLCKVLVADVVGHPGFDRRDPTRDAAFAPWSEVTDAERRDMQTQVQAGALPAACSPLQRPDAIEPACSLVLRGPDALQGWIVAHRLGEEVVQYTSLYVHPDVRRNGWGRALVAEAAHRQHEHTETPMLYH
jgi:uncharacterized protein (TIGR03032 family)